MEPAAKSHYRLGLAVLGGLPLLILSCVLLQIWVDPLSIDNGGWVRAAASLVLIEFVLVHSGAFMASGPIICSTWWQRLAWFLGLSIFYAGAFVGFAVWSGGRFVFWVLAGVMASRLATLVVLPERKGVIIMLLRSASGMVVLLLTALICLVPLPRLGISEEVRRAAFGVAEDLLSGNPERMIAWGAAYFLLMAFIEFYLGWRLPDWRDDDVNRAWETLKR